MIGHGQPAEQSVSPWSTSILLAMVRSKPEVARQCPFTPATDRGGPQPSCGDCCVCRDQLDREGGGVIFLDLLTSGFASAIHCLDFLEAGEIFSPKHWLLGLLVVDRGLDCRHVRGGEFRDVLLPLFSRFWICWLSALGRGFFGGLSYLPDFERLPDWGGRRRASSWRTRPGSSRSSPRRGGGTNARPPR